MAQSNLPAGPVSRLGGPQRFSTILGASLEAIVHELLYTLRLYPTESFSPHRFSGIYCHASRVPGVCEYVVDTLSVAVPSICAGVADALILVVMRPDSERVLGRYVFRFELDPIVDPLAPSGALNDPAVGGNSSSLETRGDPKVAVSQWARDLERRMRDVLLRVISLQGSGVCEASRWRKGDVTFKLCLHTPDIATGEGALGSSSPSDGGEVDISMRSQPQHGMEAVAECQIPPMCPELGQALQEGKWFQPDDAACLFDSCSSSDTPTDNQAGLKTANGEDIDSLQRLGSPADENRRRMKGRGDRRGMTRPLKSVDVASCGMRMQFLMEVEAET